MAHPKKTGLPLEVKVDDTTEEGVGRKGGKQLRLSVREERREVFAGDLQVFSFSPWCGSDGGRRKVV